MNTTKTTFEEAWVSEYNLFESDMAFRKARRRALLNRLFGVHRASTTNPSIIEADGSTAETSMTVPITSIKGMIDRTGRAVPGFLRMSRKHAAQWRRDYLDPDAGINPLTVQPGLGGWYLMGGVSANVLLATLKAKGVRNVRVVPWSQRVLEVHGGCDQAGSPCETRAASAAVGTGRAAS